MGFTPLYLDLSGLRVLVVGGGYVGAKRALFFKEAGSAVTVAAKEFREELKNVEGLRLVALELPRDMEKLRELVREHDLVVVAVSDERLAEEIADIALREGKLVNNTVDHTRGNVIVPFRAVVKGVGIAVTSFGVSGLAARLALEKAVKAVSEDPEIEAVLESFGKLKKQLRERVRDPKLRMRIYFAIEEDSLYREFAKKGDSRRAYERALEIARSFGVALEPLDYDVFEDEEKIGD